MSHLGRVALVVFLAGATALPAQISPEAPSAGLNISRSPEELDQLLAPIALYPDALIALILPASTAPADIVLAARQLRADGDLSQVESRPWEDSVKSLTRYPDVLRWLDDNLDWTKQVGEAFLAQPVEVMNSIQRLRALARAAGTLVDTPQQQIISAPGVVRIVPAQPDRIYVPLYDPSVIFLESSYALPRPFSFGSGYPVGSWLAYDCDWTQRQVWVGDRHRPWRGHDWRLPVVAPDPQQPRARVTQWRAPVRPAHPASPWTGSSRGRIAQPSTFTVRPELPAAPAPRTSGRHRNFPAASPDRSESDSVNHTVPRREYPGPRSNVATPPLPAAPPVPRSSQPAWAGGRSRSLPQTIPNTPSISGAPSLPMTAPALPTARAPSPPSVALTLPALPSNIAPSLPATAPSLPAVVPNFSDPPATATPPADRAPQPRRNGRGQLD